jgi:1,4-dihydroxy-2-naphthoate octaprenyltransferase
VDAARPKTLVAAVVPVAVGVAVASRSGPIDFFVAAATLGAALSIQIGTNLANDYYDFRSGADAGDRLGPRRLVQTGLASPQAVHRAALGVLAFASALGVFLVVRGGWPILAAGVLSLVCAIAYTGGPWPIAHHGLGEVFVFLFFGVVAVTGTTYLQTGQASGLSVLASLPVGSLATAILVVNNLRDIPSDRRAGKLTLAVRFGERAARILYRSLVAGAFAALGPVVAAGAPGALAAMAALPLAVREARELQRRSGAELNRSLAGTARLHLVFGLLLAAGIAAPLPS